MKRALPYILLAVGVVMIAVGVWGGEVETVLSRATHICLECIGIG
jgi:hypothetical protein